MSAESLQTQCVGISTDIWTVRSCTSIRINTVYITRDYITYTAVLICQQTSDHVTRAVVLAHTAFKIRSKPCDNANVVVAAECGRGRFTCSNSHTCVPGSLWCDGHAYCSDGSDEVPGCNTSMFSILLLELLLLY